MNAAVNHLMFQHWKSVLLNLRYLCKDYPEKRYSRAISQAIAHECHVLVFTGAASPISVGRRKLLPLKAILFFIEIAICIKRQGIGFFNIYLPCLSHDDHFREGRWCQTLAHLVAVTVDPRIQSHFDVPLYDRRRQYRRAFFNNSSEAYPADAERRVRISRTMASAPMPSASPSKFKIRR